MRDKEGPHGSDVGGFGGMDEKVQSQCQEQEHGGGFEGWWEDRSLSGKALVVVGFVILGAGLLFLFGLVVMALWNWLMPEIFGLKHLSYWQAWGLLALSSILFGKLGTGGGGGSSDRKRKRKLRSYMREDQPPAGQAAEGSSEA